MFVLLIYIFIWLILLPSLFFPSLSLFLFLTFEIHSFTRTLAITAQKTRAAILLVDRPRFSYQKKNSKVHTNEGGYIEDHEVSDL